MAEFAEQYDQYRQNVTAGMIEILADEWGVSAASVEKLNPGFNFADQAWVFPERDDKGIIVGLIRRFRNGDKYTYQNSKRGLTYILNSNYGESKTRYTPGRNNWMRVTPDLRCPLCDGEKWCMVSSDNPHNPSAVICRIEKGSVRPCGEGTFLHVLRDNTTAGTKTNSVLEPSELPILIVEGQSDVAAAIELGFVAIGKPSATGGTKYLSKMPLYNKKVIVLGENDDGIGKRGMEETFRCLQKITPFVQKLLPPEGTKDLRHWVQNGLTQSTLLEAIESNADNVDDADVFEDDVAHTIAKRFLHEGHIVNNFPAIRNYKGKWLQYIDGHYEIVDDKLLRGMVYEYLEGKLCTHTSRDGTVTIEPYKPTRSKVSDIFDALNQWCPVTDDPPVWLDDAKHPAPHNLIAFQNGILDVQEYINGKIKLYPATPALFSFNVLPYEYDDSATSELWTTFINEIFNNNQAQIKLLQEWFGYNCVADISQEKMMLFTGPPRSGKSTTLDTMQSMLGMHNCAATNFQSLCGQFGYEPLVGKLAALIGDAKTPRKSEADSALEKLLMITGGDPVTVNRKNISHVPSIRLICRFTLAMNNLPAFTDHARALEPRMNMLHFENSYVGREDRSLKIRLKEEARNGKLINFALQGLKRLREKKCFTVPLSSEKMMYEFQEVSTPIIAFMRECCVEDDSDGVDKAQLYTIWKNWCADNNRSPGTMVWFGRNLLGAYPKLEAIRKRYQNESCYFYKGVSLLKEAKDRYLI